MFEIIYQKKNNSPLIVFNDIECVFKKSGVYSYLTFCESDKNKKILSKYVEIIDQIKEEILFITEDENREFIIGKDFM